MKYAISTLALLGICLAETSTPVGFNKITCLSGSDTHVSVPFHQKPVYFGSLSADSSGSNTFSIGNTLSADVTTAPHYIKFTSGTDTEGKWFDITGSAANSITVDLNGETINFPTDTTFKVIPHWTLNSLFPVDIHSSDSNSTIHLTTGSIGFQRGTEILFPDYNTPGVNKVAKRLFFMLNSGWVERLDGATFANYPNSNNEVVAPNSTLIVRNSSALNTTTYIPKGVVETAKSEILLQSSASTQIDNPVALDRPIPITLAELDLGGNFEESLNTLGFNRRDELLVYNNSEAKFNKSPTQKYIKVSGDWLDTSNSFANANNTTILPSEHIIIRKASSVDDVKPWVNAPTY